MKFTSIFLGLLFPALAYAADRKIDPEARAAAVAPFLDANTFAVMHVVLDRLDVDASFQRFGELARIPEADLAGGRTMLRAWAVALTKAGVKDVYMVLSLSDVPLRSPFLVAPAGSSVDARAVAAALPIRALGPGLTAEVIGKAVVYGSQETQTRLRTLQAFAMPELPGAWAVAGEGAIGLVVVPTAVSRRVLEEVLPALPAELGGDSMRTFTRGVQWAAIGLPLPQVTLDLTVQSPDADAARALDGAVGRLLKALSRQPSIRQAMPEFERIAALLTPRLDGARLVLRVEEKPLFEAMQPVAALFRGSAARAQTQNNLKQIVLAFHNAHDARGRFPPTAIVDKDGKPLLSWRVQLLPYFNEEKLYKEFHLDEPWDSEHNKKLIARMPAVFRSAASPKLTAEGKTPYVGLAGDATMFPAGGNGLRVADVTDGTSSTIFVVDADDAHAVVWTKPEDLPFDGQKPTAGLRLYGERFACAWVDGSVHMLPLRIEAKTMQAVVTRNGGEGVPADLHR